MSEVINATVVDADGEVVGSKPVAPMQFAAPVVSGQLGSVAIAAHAAATQKLGEIVAAKAEPRDLVAIEKEILTKCRDSIFAEKAYYAKPQGSGYVEGLGIFFAKALAALYGNLEFATHEHNKTANETQIQCTIWDKQRNNTRTETIIVLHKKNVGGSISNITDPDAIRLEGSRQKSYLERNCLLDIFDPGMVQKCFEQVVRTLDAASSAAMANPKDTMEKYAAKFGVNMGQICKFLNIQNEKGLKPMHCRRLLALHKAIEANETTAEKVFGKASIDLEAEAAKEEPPLTIEQAPAEPAPQAAAGGRKKAATNSSSAKNTPTASSSASPVESTERETPSENASTVTTNTPLTSPSDSPAPSVQSAERDEDSPIAVSAPTAPLKQISLADNF